MGADCLNPHNKSVSEVGSELKYSRHWKAFFEHLLFRVGFWVQVEIEEGKAGDQENRP